MSKRYKDLKNLITEKDFDKLFKNIKIEVGSAGVYDRNHHITIRHVDQLKKKWIKNGIIRQSMEIK